MNRLICVLCAICGLLPARPLWAQTSAQLGTPSATSRGINRDVYIAVRTDGRAGTGTADDPFDGSTASKFDSAFRTAVGWQQPFNTYTGGTTNTTVHLGPGTFLTTGNKSIEDHFRPQLSHKVIGSGIGVTIVKLADNTATNNADDIKIFFHNGLTALVDSFELSHMTLDCNPAGQPIVASGTGNIGAVSIDCKNGYIHDLEVVGPWSNPSEGFPVELWTHATADNPRHVIERVKVSGMTGYMSVLSAVGVSGQPVSGAIRDCLVICTNGSPATNAIFGVSLSYNDGFDFTGNRFIGTGRGINMDTGTFTNITVRGNVFDSNYQGVVIYEGATFGNVVVADNTFTRGPTGSQAIWGSTTNLVMISGNVSDYTLFGVTNLPTASLGGIPHYPLMVATNAALLPVHTNFFTINSNLLNASVLSAGAGTFEATQFGTGGGATNFKQFAAVTNLQADSGTYAAPAYGFGSETNSGIHRPAPGNFAVSVLGSRALLSTGGGMTLGTNNFTGLFLSGATNSATEIAFRGMGTDRWRFLRTTAETGSDAGSDFNIQAYTDGGAFIDSPIGIVRAAGGAVTFARPLNTARQITYATNAVASEAVVYLDFSTNVFQYAAITNDITFHSTNRSAAVRATVLRMLGGTTNYALAFNTNWVFIGAAAPTTLASNKTAILSLTLYGTNETDVVAAYAVQS